MSVKLLVPTAALAALVAGLVSLPAEPAQAAGPAANGAQLFAQRCQSCHTVAPGQKGVLAPNLSGVVGRKAAAVPQFNYSPALKASNVTWTRANLDRFLQGPMRMVPGTRMVIAVPDAAQRGAILDYLSTRR